MRRGFAAAAACASGVLTLAACSAAQTTPPGSAAGQGGHRAAPVLKAGQYATLRACNQEARITEPSVLHHAAPAAVYVRGGSWVSSDDDSGGFVFDSVGPDLVASGFVVVDLDDRLGPTQYWPDQIENVKCAIRYLRANAGRLHIDPGAIGAWGQGAGGHLVALLGTAGPAVGWDVGPYLRESSWVEAVVDMAGPTDLLTLGSEGAPPLVVENLVSLFGHVPEDELGADLRAASPVTYVAPGDPPFLILDSDDDPIVNAEQSRDLSWYLGASGVPHQLVTVTGGGHDFDNAGESPSEASIVAMVVAFFVRTLVLHQPIASN